MDPLVNDSLKGLLQSLYSYIIKNGKDVSVRGIGTLETDPVILELTESSNRKLSVPTLNIDLILIKCLQTLAENNDLSVINFYENKSVNRPSAAFIFNDFSTSFFLLQLHSVYNKLAEDPFSRQAVIRWPNSYKDPSITSSLQFIIRNDKLISISSFRSNEMWKGFPTDINYIIFFQEVLASWLNMSPGKCVHFVSCPHIYKENLQQVNLFLDSNVEGEQFIPNISNLSIDNTKSEILRLLEIEKNIRHLSEGFSICSELLFPYSNYFKSLQSK